MDLKLWLRKLLSSPPQPRGAPFITYGRDGAVYFDVAGWLRTPDGQKQLDECLETSRRLGLTKAVHSANEQST